MPKFEYEAVSPANRTLHKGVIEAPSMEEALKRLTARRIFPSYFAELSSSQVNIANRIANYKKITRATSQSPELFDEPIVVPPKPIKLNIDWTYVIIAGIVIVLILWVLGARA